jgi:hypothetical protein
MIKLRIKNYIKMFHPTAAINYRPNFKIKHYVYFKYLTFTLNTKHEPLSIFGTKT